MKITATIAIDDSLLNDIKEFTHSATNTEAITIALKDWIDIYAIKQLNKKIAKKPIFIEHGNTIREANRRV
jgi:hypothetical protein